MRALCLVLLAACELQPPPPKQQAAPQQQAAPTPQAPAQQPAQPAEPPAPEAGSAAGSAAGSGSAAPKIEISEPCLAVGAKVVSVFIDSVADPAQKSVLEQSRATMTRKVGEACTTQGWSEEAQKCYLGTKTPAEIKACEAKYTPPPTAQPQPPQPGAAPAGAGAKQPEPRR
jgi:hypothetical protein